VEILRKMNKIQFENLPEAVSELLEKVSSIEEYLKQGSIQKVQNEDGLLTISEAGELLNLSTNTIYKLVQKRALPYSKKSKRLYFVKQELLDWVKTGKKKTEAELKTEAETGFINSKKNRR